MPARRASIASPPKINLYCVRCDSQIGIFENEWEHLTSSYARPKENGITFGLDVGEKTQAVPIGSAQKAAEGCMMAEVSCKTCSTTVAQCCTSAPHPSKEYLVNQQFFKLSRIFLKDAKTSERVEPSFVDTDRASSQARPASVRSSISLPPPPRPRAASAHETTNVPEFQQSYPPPTESQAPHTIQGTSSAMPTPTPIDQMHAPQSLTPSAAQPAQYGYQQQHFYYQASPAGQLRPMSANGMSALSSELVEQGAVIAECFQRVANLDGRIGSEATRTTALENRLSSTENKTMAHEAALGSTRKTLEQWQADQKAQATGCALHGETIQRQQTMIEHQQKELKNVTQKLESLSKTMDELRSTMEENRTQSLIHSAPRPDSRDFLENLEVMVTAMKEARTNDHEVKALRDENKAMKIRLKSIASAMGTAGPRHETVPEDRASSEELDDLYVLGKRKRPMNNSDQQPRKISRQVSEPVAALHQDKPPLPTPDSTRAESRSLEGSLAGSQRCASENDGPHVEKEASSSDPAPQPQILDDDDFVMIGDDGNGDVEQEHATAASGEGGDNASPPLPGEAGPTPTLNQETALNSRSSAAASTHQAHGINDPLSPMVDGQQNQLVHISRPEPSINNEWQPVPFYGPYPPTPWYSTPIHPAQYRAPFNGRAPGTHFVNGPGAVPSYFGSSIFPPSQVTPTYAAYLTSTGQRSTLGRSDTFSGAISRGQRLEEIIQRPTRPSSVVNGNPSNRADVRATILQTRQSNMSEKQTSIQPDKTNEVANAESIDFSDEENNAPTARSVTGPNQHTKPSSITPAGEPNRRTTGGTLISRTVRGFTLEPLERPVINEPPPVPSSKSKQDTFRRSTGSQPPSVMPEIMAAIQNLNSSAARHVARPEPVTNSPHLPATNTTIPRHMLAADHAKKSRLSEPVTKFSIDIVNHPTSTLTKQSTPEVRRESSNISSGSKQATGTSTVSSAYGKDVADKDGTQVSKPANRGRPRKRGRPSDHQARETGRATANPAPGDKNDDDCAVCSKGGNVLCCDGCPKVYHHRCLDPPMNPKDKLVGDWFCPSCIESRQRRKADKDTALKLQLREQVLLERNRLAQEAMDRDEVAERAEAE